MLLADVAVTVPLELLSPGWDEAWPTAAVIGLAGIVLPALGIMLLGYAVLIVDDRLAVGRRLAWAAAMLACNVAAPAAFFLAWWWRWDEPLPLFRNRAWPVRSERAT